MVAIGGRRQVVVIVVLQRQTTVDRQLAQQRGEREDEDGDDALPPTGSGRRNVCHLPHEAGVWTVSGACIFQDANPPIGILANFTHRGRSNGTRDTTADATLLFPKPFWLRQNRRRSSPHHPTGKSRITDEVQGDGPSNHAMPGASFGSSGCGRYDVRRSVLMSATFY